MMRAESNSQGYCNDGDTVSEHKRLALLSYSTVEVIGERYSRSALRTKRIASSKPKSSSTLQRLNMIHSENSPSRSLVGWTSFRAQK